MKIHELVDVQEIKKEMERTFVRGEISALQWVSTCKSLASSERAHIVNRIKTLEQFLSGEIQSDKDGTKARFVPDFHEGEK